MTGGDEDKATAETQRLDRWLWFIRIVKSRTSAAALISEGKARLNKNRVEKPSQTVRPGDVVTVMAHRQVRVVRVLALGTRRGPPAEARLLYEELTPAPRQPNCREGEASCGNDRGLGQANAVAPRLPGAGRPTKRDRRQLDRLKERDP